MRIEERDGQPYRSVSRFGPDAAAGLDDLFPRVFEWLEVRGVEPAGAPFLRFHGLDGEVEAGVPVPRASAIPASDEDVNSGTLPAGRYVVAERTGDPTDVAQATADVLAWARERGLEVDTAWVSRSLGENGFELSVRVTG